MWGNVSLQSSAGDSSHTAACLSIEGEHAELALFATDSMTISQWQAPWSLLPSMHCTDVIVF